MSQAEAKMLWIRNKQKDDFLHADLTVRKRIYEGRSSEIVVSLKLETTMRWLKIRKPGPEVQCQCLGQHFL